MKLPENLIERRIKFYNLQDGLITTQKVIDVKDEEHYFIDSNGFLHNDNGPAEIQYHQNKTKKLELYFIHGKLERKDGSARISYNENGEIIEEEFYLNHKQYKNLDEIKKQLKKKSKENKIAKYFDTDNFFEEIIITTDDSKKVTVDKDNYLHSKNNKPAYIFETDDIILSGYYKNGFLHNENGYALTLEYKKLKISPKKYYYINGTLIRTKEEYQINVANYQFFSDFL